MRKMESKKRRKGKGRKTSRYLGGEEEEETRIESITKVVRCLHPSSVG